MQTVSAQSNVTLSPHIPHVRAVYSVGASDKPQLVSAEGASEMVRRFFNPETISYTEQMVMLLLNRANRVLGWARIGEGGIHGCVADIRVIFGIALSAGATGILLAHNHPSGRLRPSTADIKLTEKLRTAGAALEIPVMDHLIIREEPGFFSFADEGYL